MNEIALSKYLAQAGIASRRKVVDLIKAGKITVNGKKIIDPAHKIMAEDVVTSNGKKIIFEHRVYLLLNKPTGYITTVSDEKGRKTVMHLIKGFNVRLYPVGRLDYDTSGLLLITNDGDLAQQLAHPRHEVTKIYQVQLDKPLSAEDFEKIKNGLLLSDGKIIVDEISFVPSKKHDQVMVQLHSGKNRIVRRIFEHLNYRVKKLDRIGYAGLTQKGLPVGKWRLLTDLEIERFKKVS